MATFEKDLKRLTPADARRFHQAARAMIADLRRGRWPRPGLRVKKLGGTDVWEMSWAWNGRATFEWVDGHVVWRRVGSHDQILGAP